MFARTFYSIFLQVLLFNEIVFALGTVSKRSCALPNNPSSRRDLFRYDDLSPIVPRVELTKQPLANPATASQKDFENFIINAANKPTNKPLFKKPTNAEVAAFIVPYQQKDYHSGNTGFYYEFGTRKQDFILTGLHGCTAAVIVNPRGIWGLHIWESESAPNRAVGFLELAPSSEQAGKFEEVPRKDPEFQAVAVDTIGRPTPASVQRQLPKWKSLADVKNGYRDPFGAGADSIVLLFTPSKSERDAAQKYATKVAMIADKIKELLPSIPRSNFVQKTYVPDDDRLHEDIQGTIFVQYTPYERDSDPKKRSPQARVRLFIENQKSAVFDKYLTSPAHQL